MDFSNSNSRIYDVETGHEFGGVGPAILVRDSGEEQRFGDLRRGEAMRLAGHWGRGSSGVWVPNKDPTVMIRGYCKGWL